MNLRNKLFYINNIKNHFTKITKNKIKKSKKFTLDIDPSSPEDTKIVLHSVKQIYVSMSCHIIVFV